MGALTKSIYNLIKAILARPVKPQATNLHWVKANKPIGEMTESERKQFVERLTDETLSMAKSKPQLIETSQKKNNNALIGIILIIALLVFSNWEKVPIYGNNAKALSHATAACNANNLIDSAKKAAVASKLNGKWFNLQSQFTMAVVMQQRFFAIALEHDEGDPVYINAKSDYLKPVNEAALICNSINQK